MKSIIRASVFTLFFPYFINAQSIHGDLYVWHKVTIDFQGPQSSENSTPNPFTDYRLDVLFTGPSNQTYKVVGFYAANGNAAETSSNSGNTWRVHFIPDEAGMWNYETHFKQGSMIAAELEGGESAGFFDGASGNFEIGSSNLDSEKDFRRKGKLAYTGEHYLQFKETGEYFLKAGVNSPEVFLEYAEFDNTPSERTYPDHIRDFVENEDPSWQNGKGKGIIGAVNYLSSIGVNALYFLTMNAYGDGKNAWPWIHQDSIFVYDVSKLDQWEIVFGHMTRKGVMPHFVLTETENESFFEVLEDGIEGGFANSRKIYFREMIARFGHHPAITWNIGEENGWNDGVASIYKEGNSDEQRIQFANYIRALTYYEDHLTIHNGPSSNDDIFNSLLGLASLTGPSFQLTFGSDVYGKMIEWRTKSNEAEHKWVMSLDEAWLPQEVGALPTWRKDVVWATFMGGGAGVEFYVGAGSDLTIQNYRDYEEYYLPMIKVRDFFMGLPFQKMRPVDNLASNGWVFAQPDSIYVYYKTDGGSSTLSLPTGTYEVRWLNPVTMEFSKQNFPQITGGESVLITSSPFVDTEEGVMILTRVDSLTTSIGTKTAIPDEFSLEQNYPNPFNPSTQITYTVAEPGFISIQIFDALGRPVGELVNTYQTPNTYQIEFNAQHLASGLYYYSLKTGDLVKKTRKMMLIK